MVDKRCLFFYPLTLEFVAQLVQLFCFPCQIVKFVFQRAFCFLIGTGNQFIVKFIESTHFMLLLLVEIVSFSYLDFVCSHQYFFVVSIFFHLFLFLFQQLNLGLGVQLVDPDPCNLIHNVFLFDLLLFYLNSEFVCLFE